MLFKKLRSKIAERKAIKEAITSLGQVIDMPFKEFKKQIRRQGINVGTMNNLIMSLTTLYNDLYSRKEAIMTQIKEGRMSKDDKKVIDALNGLYAEMTKIEQKVVWLRKKVAELSNVG